MEYISKVDGRTFTTKEALIDHLLVHYSLESEDTEIKDALQFIQSKVPLVKIDSITKNSEGDLVIEVDLYNENHELLVNESILVKKELTTEGFFGMALNSLEDVVEYLSTFYKKFEDVKEMMENRFISQSTVLTNIYTGDYNSSSIIYFDSLINDENYELHYDFGDSLEELYNQINAKFVKKIEGKVENYWDHTSNTQVFRLNGVDINNFLRDGKKAVIEIIE